MSDNFQLLSKLERTDSLCSPNFQTRLIRALELKNFEEFKDVLESGLRNKSIDLDYVYDDPRNASLLETACSCPGNSKFVDLLIKNGANIDSLNKVKKKSPLHLAIEHSDLATVQLLVDNKFTNVNIRDSFGNTPLHLAALLNKVNVINLLLKHPTIKVNETNRKNQTPLNLALRKGNKDSVLTLIKHTDVDLDDIKDFSDCTCREIMLSKFPEIELSAVRKGGCKENVDLFHLLHNRDINLFKTQVKINKNNLNQNDGLYTLLQYACQHGLLEEVKILLDNGVNANEVCECNPKLPIMIAGFHGYINILCALIEYGGLSFQVEKEGTVLHAILHGIKDYRCNNIIGSSDEIRNHYMCFEYVLNNVTSDALDINCQDMNGNTALHLAVEINDAKIIRLLLDKGAYVGFRNNSGEMAVSYISPDILKHYLDDCIITNGKQPIDYNYEIIYNYSFLAPPKICFPVMKNESQFAVERETMDSYVILSETEPLVEMSKTSELRPLLKHPVLTSFLNLKWYTIRKYFWLNVSFYVIFWLLLTLYIMNLYGTIAIDHGILIPKSQVQGKTAFWMLTIIFCSGLLLRELFQFGVSPLKYLISFENWLEMGLILVSYIVLFCGASTPQIAAIAILLSWTELVLLIGRHPSLSTNIEMFKVVCTNFLKFLAWYSLLILAFALSFFLLFNNANQTDQNDREPGSNDGDTEFFRDPGMSIFKSVIMLTGEFDAGSIPFNRYPGTSHILFVLFVFLIAIVLFNLLNGLAVSDTQTIKSNAELVGYVCRARLIAYFENVAIGDPFSCLNFMDKLTCACCCCVPPRRAHVSRSKHIKFLYTRVNLFPNRFPDSRAHILPSAGNIVLFSTPKQVYKRTNSEVSCYQRLSDWYIDSNIIKLSKEIITEKENTTSNTDYAEIMKKYNEQMEIQHKRMAEYEEKLIDLIEESTKRTEQKIGEIMKLLKQRW